MNYSIRSMSPEVAGEREAVRNFLHSQGLEYEDNIEYSIGVFDDQAMVATGSLSGNIVKGVAVHPDYRGEDLTSKVLTYLKIRSHHLGIDSLFLYTKPANHDQFISAGYSVIAMTEDVLLMEDSRKNFQDFLGTVTAANPTGESTASLIMNCNPFTLGHRFLIEKAAEENRHVLLFVVQEDRSVFPFDVRIRLIKEGIADIPNVSVLLGGNYIISGITFPGYFIKDKGRIFESQTRLDLSIFGEKIAPAGNIVRRYVGHEPFCQVTNSYNQAMKEVLPQFGIEVIEIQRRESNSKAISASEVRRRIADGRVEDTRELVPPTTYTYLVSGEAAHVLERIQGEKE